MAPTMQEWKDMRQTIRSMPERAKGLDQKLTEALYRYRFNLTTLKVKPSRMDEEIWQEYDSLVVEIPELIARSSGKLIQRPTKLQELIDDWRQLLGRQQELLQLVDRAIEAADFYDKMEAAKDEKRRQRAILDKDLKALSKAKRDLIQAVHYVVLREKGGESITSNSVLLNIDDAIDFWEESISAIHDLDSQAETDIDQLIFEINQAREHIVQASAQAEKVREIERELDELLELDAQIKRATEQSSLYDEELNRVLANLRLKAAHYWASADWAALAAQLEQAKDYTQRNLGHVRSELYVIRKRSGAKATLGSGRRAERPASSRPIALARALQQHDPQRDGQVYVDPDADSSVRYLYQDGSA